MLPPNLLFSILTVSLSAAALAPVSENSNPNVASPAHHAAKRDLLLAHNIQNITDPNLNATSNVPYTCFRRDPYARAITPTNCHTALYRLLAAPDALELKRYDRTTELPIETTWGSCTIILMRSSARSDSIFQPVLIAHAAAVVTKNCVTPQFGFQGGYATIGAGVGFMVYVSASGESRNGPSAAA